MAAVIGFILLSLCCIDEVPDGIKIICAFLLLCLLAAFLQPSGAGYVD